MTEETAKAETAEEPTEKVEAAEKATEPKQEAPASEWEPERAMNTIKQLREQEKQWKKEQKELEALRAEKQERELAEMSELEKAQAKLDALQAQNAQMQADIWRNAAAAEANLPSYLADRVKGETLEEMQADALKLAEALPKIETKKPSISPTNPANAKLKDDPAELRARLRGSSNIFDVDAIKSAGGGVIWGGKEGE